MKKLTTEGHFSKKNIYNTADRMRHYQHLYLICWIRIEQLLNKEIDKKYQEL